MPDKRDKAHPTAVTLDTCQFCGKAAVDGRPQPYTSCLKCGMTQRPDLLTLRIFPASLTTVVEQLYARIERLERQQQETAAKASYAYGQTMRIGGGG